jgi:hypothetical protein
VTDERDYYPQLRTDLEAHIRRRLTPRYSDPRLQIYAKLNPPKEAVHLEITSEKPLSNLLKSKIHSGRNLIYFFLKSARPDITGFMGSEPFADFIVVEFKDNSLGLDDIYQLRKYADLLDAKYSLLVSKDEIPEELKRLSEGIVPELLSRAGGYRRLTLVRYDPENHSFLDWLPEDPFPVPTPDATLVPPLKVRFEPQTSSKTEWEVPIEVENASAFTIRVCKILVDGAPPDQDQMELVYDSFEAFMDDSLALDENAEWYVFELPPQSKKVAKLRIPKGRHARSGEEFRVDLRLEDGILYPGGAFRLD